MKNEIEVMVLRVLIQGIRTIIDVTDGSRCIDDTIQGLEGVDAINIRIVIVAIRICFRMSVRSTRRGVSTIQCIRLLRCLILHFLKKSMCTLENFTCELRDPAALTAGGSRCKFRKACVELFRIIYF